MAKVSKKNMQASSTTELITAKEEEIRGLDKQIAELKATRKSAEAELARLNDQLKNEKLNNIGAIAESAGVSVDALLEAFKNGSILALVKDETKNSGSDEEFKATKTINSFSPSPEQPTDEVFTASTSSSFDSANTSSAGWSK